MGERVVPPSSGKLLFDPRDVHLHMDLVLCAADRCFVPGAFVGWFGFITDDASLMESRRLGRDRLSGPVIFRIAVFTTKARLPSGRVCRHPPDVDDAHHGSAAPLLRRAGPFLDIYGVGGPDRHVVGSVDDDVAVILDDQPTCGIV